MKTKNILSLPLAFGLLTAIPNVYAGNDPCPAGNSKATSLEYRVDGQKVNDFSAVKAGSEISVTFTVTGDDATEFSLVSYKMPEAEKDMTSENSSEMEVYKKSSRKGNPGSRITLKGTAPDCYYRVYFIKGCVVQTYDAASNDTYEKWGRVIDVTNGGDHSCKAKKSEKITICHVPPGNPENAHTIEVSANSWSAHEKHGDYMGECKETTPPPADTTADCHCDYDADGRSDRTYGSINTSADGQYAVKFSAGSDTAIVVTQDGTFDMIVVYYEDGTTESFSDVNESSKTIASSGSDIIAVEVNGNFIENMHKLDPEMMCDCSPDEPGEPVPVTLTYFKGEKLGPNVVKLDWQTASEENNDYFQVQRTVNMKDWKEICHVTGAGTTQEVKDYTCTDHHADDEGQNLVYYQLKQVDLNGTYEYADVIRIRLQVAAFSTSIDKVYPNPTKGRLYIQYNSAENSVFTMRLLSLDGKQLLSSKFVSSTGTQTTDLDIPEYLLKPGMYVLEVQSDNEVFRQKVYKQ